MSVIADGSAFDTDGSRRRRVPEWVAVDAAGNKRKHWAADRWVTCAYGPYNFEFMSGGEQGDLLRSIRWNALFANRWQGSGICYCESCKKLFRAFSGMELPPATGAHLMMRGIGSMWSGRGSGCFELWHLWDAGR